MTKTLTEQLEDLAASAKSKEDIQLIFAMMASCISTLRDNPALPKRQQELVAAADAITTLMSGEYYEEPSEETLWETQKDIEHYFHDARMRARGFISVEVRNGDIRADLKRISVPFHAVGNDGVSLWIPPWVASALQAYRANGGFADLPLWKYLNKMKPVPEPEEESHSHWNPQACKCWKCREWQEEQKRPNTKRKVKAKSPRLKNKMGVR